ncbi:MAG: DUF373 family protein [Candidatus Diapherotrites archaeon]
MTDIKSVLVVCVDRDDDFGRKAGIEGPVIGKKEVLNAAAKLALADPEDSDSNTAFAAAKKLEEAKKVYANAEVCLLTGKGKFGTESDKRIFEQLETVWKKFPADGIILVTDGAEDDQVIPLLQNRAPIVGKETVYVKQAKEVEGAYYAVKEALKDPVISKIAFGIPGIILLLIFALPSFGIQILVGVIGVFLVLYGFGIWDKIANIVKTISKSITEQRSSLFFYLAALFGFAFAVVNSYLFYTQTETIEIVSRSLNIAMNFIFVFVIAAEFYVLGKAVDVVHFKRAFLLRKYLLMFVSFILIYFILDSAKRVFLGESDLLYFFLIIIACFGIFYAAYAASKVFDVRKKITKLLIGLPVYSKAGEWIGKVSDADRDKQSIEYTPLKGKENVKAKKGEFSFLEGKIQLTA